MPTATAEVFNEIQGFQDALTAASSFAEVDAFLDGLASAPRLALIEAVGLWGYRDLPRSKPKALSFIRSVLENYLKCVQRTNF